MARRDRERELARRRYERRQQRLVAQRAKARRRNAIIASTLALLLVLGGAGYGIALLLGGDNNDDNTLTTPSATPTPAAGVVACGAKAAPAPSKQTYKAEPKMSIDTRAKYTMILNTSCGRIDIALEAAKAPKTVNSLAFLAGKRFYDGTFCHRETTSPTLTVLQCGDPTGTGSGGPGYTLPEENLKGAKYNRGVVAMAKSSAPHSTGSQFFLIDKNSQLPAQYTVFGHITRGLAVLDRILLIGQDNANGQGDGAPKQKVYLNTVTVAKT